MDAMFITNTILFVVTLIYGVAFGVSNWFLWLLSLLSLLGGNYGQNSLGRFLDAAFLISIIYFYTFGYSYIEMLMSKI